VSYANKLKTQKRCMAVIGKYERLSIITPAQGQDWGTSSIFCQKRGEIDGKKLQRSNGRAGSEIG
jgi:hypothetical protein